MPAVSACIAGRENKNMRDTAKKSKNIFYAHITLIILTAVVFFSACMQKSVWFDEAFTLGLIQNDFFEMIRVSVFDVHPPLYYMLLKLFTYIFGASYYSVRIFSAVGAVLLSLLGITHIKKDFGEKTGFYFSLFVLLFGGVLTYAAQMRMYTWAALFVTLASIYAYRMINDPKSKSIRTKFILSTVASAYTHYFALFAVCIINLLLLIDACKEKKADSENKTKFKNWFINAAWQIGLFLPGMIVFIYQTFKFGKGWQQIVWPDLVVDFTSYHLLGTTLETVIKDPHWLQMTGAVFCLIYIAILLLFIKTVKEKKESSRPAKYAAYAYYGLMVFVLAVSLLNVIYHVRYTIVIIGLLIFMTAWLLAHLDKKSLKAILLVFFCLVFCLQSVGFYKKVYDPSGNAVEEYLSDKLEEGDIFVFDRFEDFAVTVNYPENEAYYYHAENWDAKAYIAFQKNSHIIKDIENCSEIKDRKGRVWVLGYGKAYDYIVNTLHAKVLREDNIDVLYAGRTYRFTLADLNG